MRSDNAFCTSVNRTSLGLVWNGFLEKIRDLGDMERTLGRILDIEDGAGRFGIVELVHEEGLSSCKAASFMVTVPHVMKSVTTALYASSAEA
jgi:hypothetical protein